MEVNDVEKTSSGDDMATLNRNRSFKLVRSQAIRESHSPPRTLSPKTSTPIANDEVPPNVRTFCESVIVNSSQSSCSNNKFSSTSGLESTGDKNTQSVEIQITSNTSWCQESPSNDQRQRAKRWLGTKHHSDSTTDLLSNSPRVTCVCGNCRLRPRLDDLGPKICPDCRGRRRRFPCPAKQDSGIVCSDECLDCSDNESHTNESPPQIKKELGDDVETQQTYCSCPDSEEKGMQFSLHEFDERNEPTGAQLIAFFKDTLNKCAKDRACLLKIEKELHTFVTDPGRTLIRFPGMTSYHRMLVHRCANLFQLSHSVDHVKGSVIVSKCGTSGGRIPCTDFSDWCTVAFPDEEAPTPELQAKSILKRDALSLDETNGSGGAQCMSARSKSLEQREKEYEQARRRIFSSELCTQNETQWPFLAPGNLKLLTSENGKNKLLKVQSLETPVPPHSRGAVAKSHSFGGYEPPPPTRVLSRQGDLASSSWRLSPSSSGYKTLSLRSTDSVTPSPTGDISPEPGSVVSQLSTERPLVWAISDLSSIPIGALIIHPQTGCPLTNADGTLYHYHPANPPIFQDIQQLQNARGYDNACAGTNVQSIEGEQNAEKKRGRLEKQHSFIENEYECQSEVCDSKKCSCNDKMNWCEDKTPEKCQACEASDKVQKPQEMKQSLPNNQQQVKEQKSKTTANKQSEQTQSTNQQQAQLYTEKDYEQYSRENQAIKQECVQEDTKSPPETAYTENNMEQMSLQVYSAPMSQAYTYPSHCRVDQHLQQPIYAQIPEEQKVLNPGLHEPSFRIDPTYPYHPQSIQEMGSNLGYVNGNYVYHLPNCNGCCGLDPHYGVLNCVLNAQRSYALPYAQNLEANVMPSSYPMTNVLLSHPPVQYPYTPIQYPLMPMQTPAIPKPVTPPSIYIPQELPLYQQQIEKQELYPVHNQTYPVHNQTYPLHNQIYPVYPYQNYQYPYLMPQHSVCSVYPVVERERVVAGRCFEHNKFASKKVFQNSNSGSSRTTPLESAQQPEVKTAPYESKFTKQNSFNETDTRRKPFVRSNSVRSDISQRECSSEISAKIQQIKLQMAQLNTGSDKEKCERKVFEKPKVYDDYRRNRNPGILGSYPNNNQYRTRSEDTNESNLTAQALVNSIRQNLHVKGTYNTDTRRDYQSNGRYYKHDYYNDRNYRRKETEYTAVQNRDGNSEKRDSNSNGEVKTHNFDRNRTPDTERNSQPRFEHPVYRNRPVNAVAPFYRPPFVFRQMTPTWCRRSPAPMSQTMPHPRRPPPDSRRRQ